MPHRVTGLAVDSALLNEKDSERSYEIWSKSAKINAFWQFLAFGGVHSLLFYTLRARNRHENLSSTMLSCGKSFSNKTPLSMSNASDNVKSYRKNNEKAICQRSLAGCYRCATAQRMNAVLKACCIYLLSDVNKVFLLLKFVLVRPMIGLSENKWLKKRWWNHSSWFVDLKAGDGEIGSGMISFHNSHHIFVTKWPERLHRELKGSCLQRGMRWLMLQWVTFR